MQGAKGFGTQKGGWSVTYAAGHFGDDVMARDIVNYGGLWANAISEAIYFADSRTAKSNFLMVARPMRFDFRKAGSQMPT